MVLSYSGGYLTSEVQPPVGNRRPPEELLWAGLYIAIRLNKYRRKWKRKRKMNRDIESSYDESTVSLNYAEQKGMEMSETTLSYHNSNRLGSLTKYSSLEIL